MKPLELMRVLLNGVVADEVLAAEIATIADSAEQDGRFDEAKALRVIVRNHRIKILEAQGRIAALREI